MPTEYGTLPPTPAGIRRLEINGFDLAAITHDVDDWLSHGKYASCDTSRCRDGVATVRLENLAAADGSLMVFEMHKLGRRGLLRTRSFWVVQLYSAVGPDGPLAMRGCVWGKTCASAILDAHRDVRHGFLSIADFEMASGVPA